MATVAMVTHRSQLSASAGVPTCPHAGPWVGVFCHLLTPCCLLLELEYYHYVWECVCVRGWVFVLVCVCVRVCVDT